MIFSVSKNGLLMNVIVFLEWNIIDGPEPYSEKSSKNPCFRRKKALFDVFLACFWTKNAAFWPKNRQKRRF